MTSAWCYKCPHCGEVIELESDELNHGDGDETELECSCGLRIKCIAFHTIDYRFTVQGPDGYGYNVGVYLKPLGAEFGSFRPWDQLGGYMPCLENEDEWCEISEMLADQEAEE